MTTSQCFELVGSYSLQVLAIVFVGRLLERRVYTSEDRCLVWNCCFLSILMLGLASLTLPRFHLVQPWINVDSEKLLSINSAQSIIGRAIVFVWAAGAAVSILKLMARQVLIHRTLRRCRKLGDAE